MVKSSVLGISHTMSRSIGQFKAETSHGEMIGLSELWLMTSLLLLMDAILVVAAGGGQWRLLCATQKLALVLAGLDWKR